MEMMRERAGRALGPMGARERGRKSGDEERERREGARSHESKREKKKEGEERMEMGRERAGRALGPMRVREGRSRGEKEEEGKR